MSSNPPDRKRRWPRVVLVAVVLGFCASLVGNAVLLFVAKRLYAERCALELDPVGLSRFPVDAVSEQPSSIVLFGDSRAAHWRTPETIAGHVVFNRGISGQTSAQVLARLDAHVLSLKPRVVVLEVGMNDLKTIPLFESRREEIVDQCIGNIEAMANAVVASGSTVVVVTVFPVGDIPIYRRPLYSSEVDDAIRRVNDRIRALANNRIHVLDADEFFLAESGRLRSGFGRDMLHLNAAGYAELNARLLPLLIGILEPTDHP